MIAPTRVARRVPLGLLGMLALIVAVEATLSGRHADLATVWADDWRRTAEATATQARGRDVLCFGDSLVKYGVLPKVIAARTGLTGYNLAVNAGTVPSEFFLLRRTLASGVRPRAIVADFFTLMLPDEPRGSVRNYPELMTLRDAVDLAWFTGDADLLASVLLGRLLPSLRCRFEIRDDLRALATRQPTGPRPMRAVRVARGSWKKHQGAQPMPRTPEQPARDPGLVAGLTPPAWTIDAINAHYAEAFLALAERHGIPVFWVIPPLGPEVEAGRLARGTAATYTRVARAMQVRHPSLVVVDARGSAYGASAHCDPIHLNEPGARAWSGDLARVVADHLAGRADPERWVDLPPFAEPGAAPPRRVAVGSDPVSSR